MAKRKNARTKATRKATTAARKPAKSRAPKASRAKGASASSRGTGRKKTAARATRKAAPKKTVKAAKKAAARPMKKAVKKSAARRAAPVAKRAKAGTPVKAAKATRPVKKAAKARQAPVKAMKATRTAKAAPKAAKRTAPAPVVAVARPAPSKAVAANGSPAKAPAPRKAKRDSAGARERATTRHSEPSADRPSIPSSLNVDRSPSQARSGGHEMREQFKEHNESSPALTAGDVDADWEQAYSSGDEAPGGDNPTPDQDVVDDIGRALGVEYQDSEELKGADKISERDKHRWELDPASSEDYPNRDE
jgi:Family of unknown function (DUF6335)